MGGGLVGCVHYVSSVVDSRSPRGYARGRSGCEALDAACYVYGPCLRSGTVAATGAIAGRSRDRHASIEAACGWRRSRTTCDRL
ncbi:hypothetical protein LA76x_3078 [Lysobacter antibioticus]|uniref:Uncharacterized protein n=1 Tax=Lysobacter antibioticus TaxID=84531 RepID=A0A0S2FCI1_LYSAN|nr:hypothetical protein LA76x_3078 [Lysobacter antibioticus]